MPARQQIGIVLIAGILGLVLTSTAIRSDVAVAVQRLGYDIPSAVYPERPSEASNKFRISLVANEDLQEIRVRTYWLRSRAVPNSTLLDPEPSSDYVRSLASMVPPMGYGYLLELEVSYAGSPSTAFFYDFNPVLGTYGSDLEGSPSCFAFIVDPGGSVVAYFEGVMEFFPFPGRTISSLRARGISGTEVYSPSSLGPDPIPLDEWEPGSGTWVVQEPRESHTVELVVLLSEDARLYLEKEWGSASERMQLTILEVDGEHEQTWIEFV